jgi:biotin transport system substrate-specific component
MYISHAKTTHFHGNVEVRSHLYRILFALTFTGITGLCAQIRFYLPFTPVPVTGQVFAVLLSGAILGKEYGSLSQLLYVLAGLAGIPWFVLGPVGPTAGYLVGFILAPCAIGLIREKIRRAHLMSTMLSLTAGLAVIYLFGLLHFTLFTGIGISRSITLSVLPFLPFDVLKALLAASIAQILLHKARVFPYSISRPRYLR